MRVWFGHLWFGFGIRNFPLKIPIFSIFFTSGQKNLCGLGQKVPRSKMGWPLIYCGSKVCSSQGPSLLWSDFEVSFWIYGTPGSLILLQLIFITSKKEIIFCDLIPQTYGSKGNCFITIRPQSHFTLNGKIWGSDYDVKIEIFTRSKTSKLVQLSIYLQLLFQTFFLNN